MRIGWAWLWIVLCGSGFFGASPARADAPGRPRGPGGLLGVGMLGVTAARPAPKPADDEDDGARVTVGRYQPGAPSGRAGSLIDQVSSYARAAVLAHARGASRSRPRFFMVPFGYQSPLNDPHKSHTFASYARVTGPTPAAVEWFTISWLPATFGQDLKIVIFGDPVPGRNYRMDETLAFADRARLRVACWGPYEITEALHRAATRRQSDLRSGRFLYVPADQGDRERGVAMNCMHAVSDLAGELSTYGGLFNTGLGIWGIKGTKHVLEHHRAHGAAWMREPVDPDRFMVWKPGA